MSFGNCSGFSVNNWIIFKFLLKPKEQFVEAYWLFLVASYGLVLTTYYGLVLTIFLLHPWCRVLAIK